MNLSKLKNAPTLLIKVTALSLALLATPIAASTQKAGSSKQLEVPQGFNFAQQRLVTLDLQLSQANALAVRVYGLNFESKDMDSTQVELPSLLNISKLSYGTRLYKTIEVPIQYIHLVIDYGQDNVQPVLIPKNNVLVVRD